jgi:hypothetical protein
MPTGNKGEWSEFYAFLKLLGDKKLFAADSNLAIIQEKYFDILQVVRYEAKAGKKVYDITKPDNQIRVLTDDGVEITVIDSNKISSKIAGIFEKIKSETETTFEIPLADEAMADLHCTQIKAESLQKSDIFLVIHDRISPVITEQGFSIKSMLGGPSTLLNASGATNFTFQVNDLKETMDSINLIDGSSKIRERADKIYTAGAAIVFKEVENERFRRNLRKIDTVFPEIMAEILLAYYKGNGRTISELVANLEENKILQSKYDLNKEDYEYKIKNFLASIALGMTPNTEWDGLTTAQGGYIIVKENGDLVCYHLYNRDEFQDYLFKNTKLETASTSRHEFGTIYEKDGKKYLKLNLQIRFIK